MRLSREKTFGSGRAVPLDRNAKARIQAYARARRVTSVKLVWNRGVVEQPIDTFAPLEKPMQLA
jgi:hypothetical protein